MTEPPPPPSVRPPPPPSSRRLPSGEANFFRDLLEDLAVRAEWLGQVIDSVPPREAAAVEQLRGWAKALHDLREAIAHVQAHLDDRRFARLFALEGPLAAFLSRLYAWCEQITGDFEDIALKLRRQQPVLAVFSHRAVNASFTEFQQLGEALRRSLARLRPSTPEESAAWSTFDADFEELLWATEWLHMSLARRPGGG